MFLFLHSIISNMFLHFIIFFLVPQAISSSNPIAKDKCPEKCGNLTIPYPFGVGAGCFRSGSFSIICNYSSGPPKAQLAINPKLEVLEITTSHIRVNYPYLLNSACYDESGKLSDKYRQDMWYQVNLSSTQYTFSDENWLTAVGCDDLVLGTGRANQSFGDGCVAYCADAHHSGGNGFCLNNGDGYSPGNGCCRTPIPRGTTLILAQLSDLSRKWNRSKVYPCSYAFIEEKVISNESRFSYPLDYLEEHSTEFGTSDLNATKPSVVRLDWRTGSENCSQERQTTTFACMNNTKCIDFDAVVGGYNCRCIDGYDGHPYLAPGCMDINECANTSSNPCPSNSDCINSLGSFNCRCHKGFYGDARLEGFGCERLPTSKNSIAIGLGSGIGFLLLLSICFWLRKEFKRRNEKIRKDKFFKRNGGLLLQQKTNEGTIRKTKHFPAKELEKATDHYNESRILGQGGQGTVYKGMLSDGKIVAIKKLKQVDEDQLEQFVNEIVILSQVDHRNVVKLLGCCLENDVPLLLYEYVPNGTLFHLIHDPDVQFPMSWNMRLKIAADIAGALAYLHSSVSIPIYHRDIKSSNILLGEKFVVKVSDFGTSKSVEVDKTHLTTMVKGTFGYLDPEYFQSCQFTDKSDVYSFGVVLTELLTGQRPISSKRSQDEKSLATMFLASMEENNLHTILDPLVIEHGLKEEVTAVARLAQRCLNLKGKMRPTMKEVATELANYSNNAQMSIAAKDESAETRAYEAKAMMISDIEYTWTTSGHSAISSSSDTHPFMSEAV